MAIENVFFPFQPTHTYIFANILAIFIYHTQILLTNLDIFGEVAKLNILNSTKSDILTTNAIQGYCVQSILIPISLMNRHVVLFKSFNVSPSDKWTSKLYLSSVQSKWNLVLIRLSGAQQVFAIYDKRLIKLC